jgi:hypothetical protein
LIKALLTEAHRVGARDKKVMGLARTGPR